jgi:hypothetical protein
MTELLEDAADALERRVFFDQLSARYAELREDPVIWSDLEIERTRESGSLSDGST